MALDPASRRVVIGPRSGGTTEIRLRDVNWLTPPRPLRCTVKLRAREEPHGAGIIPEGSGAIVQLDTPALPAPGQACVFYDGNRVLGGGVIRAG